MTTDHLPDRKEFTDVLEDARDIVYNRGCREGRNRARAFWETFPHGLSDMTFMIRDKADRVLGAELSIEDRTAFQENFDFARLIETNCLDIINYCVFVVLWLRRMKAEEHPSVDPLPPHVTEVEGP